MMIYRSVQLPNKSKKYLYRQEGENLILLTPDSYTDLSEVTPIIAQSHGLSELVIRALITELHIGPFGIWTLDLTPLFAEQPVPEVPEELTEESTEQKEEAV